MKKLTKTVDVLKRARRTILRHGWCQGRMYSTDGAHCALGAIYGNISDFRPNGPEDRAIRYFNAVVGQRIPFWNDAPERLVGEVILAFDQAIKNAKRRHIDGK